MLVPAGQLALGLIEQLAYRRAVGAVGQHRQVPGTHGQAEIPGAQHPGEIGPELASVGHVADVGGRVGGGDGIDDELAGDPGAGGVGDGGLGGARRASAEEGTEPSKPWMAPG